MVSVWMNSLEIRIVPLLTVHFPLRSFVRSFFRLLVLTLFDVLDARRLPFSMLLEESIVDELLLGSEPDSLDSSESDGDFNICDLSLTESDEVLLSCKY